MANALTITVIGMSLVFIGLLLLWLMMAAIVRLTRTKGEPVPAPSETNEAEVPSHPADKRHKAAAAAVVAAALLTRGSATPLARFQIKHGTLSPWQTAHRSLQMKTQFHSKRRKE